MNPTPTAPTGSPITPIDPKQVRVHTGPIDRAEQQAIEAQALRSLIKKSGGKPKGAHGGGKATAEIQELKKMVGFLQATIMGMAEKYKITPQEAMDIGAMYLVRQVRSE